MPLIALVDTKENVLASHIQVLDLHGISCTRSYNNPEDLLTDMDDGLDPDMIVTDFYMPGMNGAELLSEAQARRGKIPGILLTGYPEAVPAVKRRYDRFPVLSKQEPSFYIDLIGQICEAISEKGSV